MMKRILITSLAIVAFAASSSFLLPRNASARYRRESRIIHTGGEGGDFGLGVVLGEPTGLTGKYWLNRTSAVDVGLAYSFNDFFLIYSDYLYHFHGAFGRSSRFATELTPYVGIGGVLFIESSSTTSNRAYFKPSDGSVGLAMRIPLGMEWRPTGTPFGVFAELVPGLGIIPSTFGLIEAGIGGRFYF